MDCFHDFCLACDKESMGGAYCSQACRLADLERANTSTPASPTSPSTLAKSRTSWSTATSASNLNMTMSPAYSFSQSVGPSSNGYRPQTSYFTSAYGQQQHDEAQRALSPSSSRTSLASTSSDLSVSAPSNMSQQARLELQEYFNSFGQAKASNRRPSK